MYMKGKLKGTWRVGLNLALDAFWHRYCRGHVWYRQISSVVDRTHTWSLEQAYLKP